MLICWAHYKRAKRGSKKDSAVREYGTGQVLINSPKLAPAVWAALRTAVKQYCPEAEEPSLYEAERRVLREWLVRYDAGLDPFLAGRRALDEAVLSSDGYHQGSMIPLLPDEKKIFDRALAQAGLPTHALLVMVFDDWYWYWTRGAAVTPPMGTQISAFGPDAK